MMMLLLVFFSLAASLSAECDWTWHRGESNVVRLDIPAGAHIARSLRALCEDLSLDETGCASVARGLKGRHPQSAKEELAPYRMVLQLQLPRSCRSVSVQDGSGNNYELVFDEFDDFRRLATETCGAAFVDIEHCPRLLEAEMRSLSLNTSGTECPAARSRRSAPHNECAGPWATLQSLPSTHFDCRDSTCLIENLYAHNGRWYGVIDDDDDDEKKKRVFFEESYQASTACEILLIPQKAFDLHLRPAAFALLRSVYETLSSSRVFEGWDRSEFFRLAKFAQRRRFQRGAVLLRQAEKAPAVFFLTKGLCGVFRSSDPLGSLTRKLESLRRERNALGTNYVYHRSLRHKAAQLPHLMAEVKATSFAWAGVKNSSFLPLPREKQSKKETTSLFPPTITDYRLSKLDADIDVCRSQLEAAGRSDLQQTKRLSTLMAPKVFGEAQVVDPSRPDANHTIVAETLVEALLLQPLVFHLFDLSPNFRTLLTRHARIPQKQGPP